MTKDAGVKMLELLRLQRTTFEILADGTKRLINPYSYMVLEDELYKIQKKIGRENKKKLSKKTLSKKEGIGGMR